MNTIRGNSSSSTNTSLVWIHVPHDSAEYARYEAAEKAAHEAARGAPVYRSPNNSIGAHHLHDTTLIRARPPACAGMGIYLFVADHASSSSSSTNPPSTHLDRSMPRSADKPALRGWMPEAHATAWLRECYPHACSDAAACMAACAGQQSMCACGVVDPDVGTVRFYIVPAAVRRRQRCRPSRGRHRPRPK
jgi:hypothetical protein